MSDVDHMAAQIRAGDRRTLSRAITLIESSRAQDRAQAEALLSALSGADDTCLRVGLSGTPGVGKSTFIEALGTKLTAEGHRVAVLAVDPSSTRSGGSILGDKTRMETLSRNPAAFIRPSPAGGELGGVARRTREAAHLCAAAGFDIVLIETVGVGQSEVTVAAMSDVFLLLMAPAGGDELQGVKRGIMEIADMVLVNKADGALEGEATRTCADYAGALRLLRARPGDPDGFPKAGLVSALTGRGLDTAWADVQSLIAARRENGAFAARRTDQASAWFHSEVRDGLVAATLGQPAIANALAEQQAAVAAGTTTPTAAARAVLDLIRGARAG